MSVLRTRLLLPESVVSAFCEKWGVAELYVFGSVVREDFGPSSDLDIAVRFRPEVGYSLFDLMEMQDQLADLSGRPVDLLTLRAIEQMPNALRRRSILDTLELVHAA